MLIIVSISCCCGARASHTLSTHTTQHLIWYYVMFHIIDFVNTCVHRQSPPVVLHSQPHGTLVQQKCQKSSRHLDTVQFSCPSSALVTLVHCDGHSRFITVSKSLYDFGHFFSTCVSCGYIVHIVRKSRYGTTRCLNGTCDK